MPLPTLIQAGTGVTVETGSGAVTLSGATVGNLGMLHVLNDGVSSDWTRTAISGIKDLAEAADSVTDTNAGASGGRQVGAPEEARQFVYSGRITASSVTLTMGVGAAGHDLIARWYEFEDASAGSLLSEVFCDHRSGGATSSSLADPPVPTWQPDCLGLAFVAVNQNEPLGDFVGESGGTWTFVHEYASPVGSLCRIGLHTSPLATAGTLDGGVNTLALAQAWGVYGTAIRSNRAIAVRPYRKRAPVRAGQSYRRGR